MTGFEPRFSGIASDHAVDCAKTTARLSNFDAQNTLKLDIS